MISSRKEKWKENNDNDNNNNENMGLWLYMCVPRPHGFYDPEPGGSISKSGPQ